MKTKMYTVLGWMAWQGVQITARRKFGTNKVKIGAGAVALGVLAAGAVAAKVASSGNE